MSIQLFQHLFLEKICFLYGIIFTHLVIINCPSLCGSVSGFHDLYIYLSSALHCLNFYSFIVSFEIMYSDIKHDIK